MTGENAALRAALAQQPTFGIGGVDKKNSSSWILKNWKFESENRVWGLFYNLFDSPDVKVKELVIKPKKGMSFQRHKERNEIWLVSKGSCEVLYSNDKPDSKVKRTLKKFDKFTISGQSSDPILHPKLDKILSDIYKAGKDCTVHVAASHKPEKHWIKCFKANPNAFWYFGIDGLTGTGNVKVNDKLTVGDASNYGQFQFIDGNQGPNRILKSDANGNAQWVQVGSLGIGVMLKPIYDTNTNSIVDNTVTVNGFQVGTKRLKVQLKRCKEKPY